jgi:hypothetical protein
MAKNSPIQGTGLAFFRLRPKFPSFRLARAADLEGLPWARVGGCTHAAAARDITKFPTYTPPSTEKRPLQALPASPFPGTVHVVIRDGNSMVGSWPRLPFHPATAPTQSQHK